MSHDAPTIRIAYVDPSMTAEEWEAFFVAERQRRTSCEANEPTIEAHVPLPVAATDEALPRSPHTEGDLRTSPTATLLATVSGCEVAQAESLLQACHDTLRQMSGRPLEWYVSQGLTQEQAERLCNAFELARRWGSSDMTQTPMLTSSRDIVAYMGRYLVDLDHEEVWMVALSPALMPLAKVCLTHGGISTSVVDVRLTLLEVLRAKATRFVLLHNHPGGAPTPSPQDDAVTAQLCRAAKQLDLHLIDHIIIGQGHLPVCTTSEDGPLVSEYRIVPPAVDAPQYAYYSYADSGTLPL